MSNNHVIKLKTEFRNAKKIAGLSPDVVEMEFQKIYQKNGILKPGEIINTSRPDKAPLHSAFQWNDFKAAEQHRRWQAMQLIKAVVVVADDSGNKNADKRRAQVWVHTPTTMQGESGYHPVTVVANNPSMFAASVLELTKKLDAARASLDALIRAASEDPDTDTERMARIAMATQALQTAGAAVQALH